MKLTAALELFQKDRGDTIAKQTLHTHRYALRSLSEAGLTDTKDMTRGKVAEWLSTRREKDLAATTINVQLASVLSLLSHLEKQGKFPLQRLHQLRRLRMKQPPAERPYFLNGEQFSKFRFYALSVHPQLELAVMFAVFGGLRLNEIRRVASEDLIIGEDVGLPYIRVLNKGRLEQTKTRRERVTPIAQNFAAELRARNLPPGPIFAPISVQSHGPYLSRETLRLWLADARDKAELHKVTWLTLRHCFASWLRSGGVEISKICGWMGNTARVCEAFYAALAPGGDSAIEKMFGAGSPAAPPKAPAPPTEKPAPEPAVAEKWVPRILRRDGTSS